MNTSPAQTLIPNKFENFDLLGATVRNPGSFVAILVSNPVVELEVAETHKIPAPALSYDMPALSPTRRDVCSL